MRKINLTFIFLLMLIGCKKESTEFHMEGEITGFNDNKLLIYSLDNNNPKVDTIEIQNNRFSFQTAIDTLNTFMLIFPGLEEFPIYADKSLQVSIKGDSAFLNQLQIKGGILNDQLNDFRQSTVSLEPDTIQAKADSFIRNNPYSRVSVHLLNKYFIEKEEPDFKRIQELVESMSGDLRDLPFIKQLNDPIKKQQEMEIGKRVLSFSLKNKDNEIITTNSPQFKNKYLLINFWASWCTESLQQNSTIKQIAKKHKKKDIDFMGISLDTDRQTWLETIKRDTLKGEQLNDFQGWNNIAVTQWGVERLPSNVLIDSKKTIVAKNLSNKELEARIDELFPDSSGKNKKK